MPISQELEKRLKNFKSLSLEELTSLLEDTQKEGSRLKLENKTAALEAELLLLETYIKDLHAHVIEIRLKTMPPQVTLSDLEDPENGLLLSHRSLGVLEEYQNGAKVKKNSKLNRKDTKLLYSAIPDYAKGFHILFHGKKFNIGSGSWGNVKVSQHTKTGEWCAVKISKKEPASEYCNVDVTDQQEYFLTERKRLIDLKQFKSAHVETKNQTRKNYLFKTYIPGEDLFEFFLWLRTHTEECSISKFLEICSLMAKELKAKCHDQGVVHCDIKPENFICNIVKGKILGENTVVTLTDHALSLKLPVSTQEIFKKVVGSPHYTDPELLGKFEGTYSRATDIYALGTSFYEFALGVKDIFKALFKTAVHLDLTFRKEMVQKGSSYKNDILNLFSKKYSESLSIQRSFTSEYRTATKLVQSVITLILHMTDPVSKKRPDINSVIQGLDALIQLQKLDTDTSQPPSGDCANAQAREPHSDVAHSTRDNPCGIKISKYL